MPPAISLCQASQRLVPVDEFNSRNQMECTSCTLTLYNCERVTSRQDKFYALPAHRAVGERNAKKIDWSTER